MTTSPLSKQREWLLLLSLAGMQFTHIMDFMVMMPLGPQLMRLLHITPTQFGFLVSTYTLSAAIVGFLAAFIVDRFDRKRTLLVLYAGFICATLLCALADSYASLMAGRAIAGAFGGMLGATVMSIVGDVIPESRRATAMGTVMSAFSLAAVAGVPTGLLLAEHFSWRAPFIFLCVLSLPLWLIAYRFIPAVTGHLVPHRAQSPWSQIHYIFTQPAHLKAYALIACLMFAGFSVIPFISPYMVANGGLTEVDLKYIYLCGGAATFFTARLIGKLADKIGKPRVFTALAILSLPAILALTHWRPAPLSLTLMASTLFMVVVSGRFIPAMAMVTSSVLPQHRGSFMGFNSAIQSLCSGLAALMSGALIHRAPEGQLLGYDHVGYIACGFTLVCILIVQHIRPLDSLPLNR